MKEKSEKAKSFNISELIKSKASPKRAKAIRTLAKRRNISRRKAKELQAKAIASSQ